jgi:hypothetical protein
MRLTQNLFRAFSRAGEAIVNADEIRAEIERRKKTATDLKLREVVWRELSYKERRTEERERLARGLVFEKEKITHATPMLSADAPDTLRSDSCGR